MAITPLQILAKIGIDSKDAEAGMQSFGKSALGVLGPLAAVGGGAVVAAVAVGGAAIKMAGDFQEGMTSLVTGAGESEKNIGLVRDAILKMAVDTGTSTQQLTAGMYMIESAGYHGAAGLSILDAAAKGAKVGNADLGVVADATTTILTDFGKQAGGATGAVNLLVATVASGKTHMQDLATSLSQVAPTAAAAHVGLDDMLGAMATMTGEGAPAANAATYLRQTILALDAPSKQAQKALANVGLSSKDVAAAMQQSLPDALKMITDAVGKKFPVGSAQYVAALKDISGGSKQMQGVLDLTGDHMQTFIKNTNSVGGAAVAGGKSITGWSNVQGDFNFKLGKAKEVVETFMIQLGTKLLPVAGQVVDLFSSKFVPAITALVGGIQHVIQFGQNLIKFFQDTGPASTGAKVAILVLTGALVGMAASAIPAAVTAILASVTAFGAQTVAAGAAAIAVIAATWPFIAIGAAIAVVIAIVILAVTHWGQITTALGHFKDMLGNVLGAIGNFIGGGIGKLGDALNGLKQIAQNVGGAIGGAIKGGINVIIGDIDSFIRFLDSIQIHIPSIGAGPVHTPSFDWAGLGIPTIPLLAEGGVITSPGQVIVGEAGPERLMLPAGAGVVPLPAGMRAAPGAMRGTLDGQPIVVNLYLDNMRFGQVVAKVLPEAVRNATGSRGF